MKDDEIRTGELRWESASYIDVYSEQE